MIRLLRPVRALAIVALACLPAAAHAQAPTDADVKAAYVYHFGRFVTWPPAAVSARFEICLVGRDPLGDVLETTVQGQLLEGRPVVLRRVSPPADVTGCHVVYVGRSEDRRLAERLAEVRDRPVLTVSDIPEFVARGGMIELVNEGTRVRFLVDPARARAAGLTLGSDLLRVARLYERPGPGAR